MIFLKKIFILLCLLGYATIAIADDSGAKSSASTPIVLGGVHANGMTVFPNDENTRRIVSRNAIQDEARLFEKQGLFEEAIEKFEEAIKPELLNRESEKSMALGGIMRIHQKQGNFDQALQDLQWFLSRNPTKDFYVDKRRELEALIEAQNNGTNDAIYAHILYLQNKYKNLLPPKRYVAHSATITTTIIRLYDYVGDIDSAIKYVNGVLSYKKLWQRSREEYEMILSVLQKDRDMKTKGSATEALTKSTYFVW